MKVLTRCQGLCLGGRDLVDFPSLIDEAPFSHFEVQVTSDLGIKQHLNQLTYESHMIHTVTFILLPSKNEQK